MGVGKAGGPGEGTGCRKENGNLGLWPAHLLPTPHPQPAGGT